MSPEEASTALIKLREELEERLRKTHRHMAREERVSADFSEQSVERGNDELVQVLDQEGRAELKLITKALARIEEGTFGRCTACGSQINSERLRALPYSDHCISCAEKA
jgi:DnaK suppressor protein